MAGTVGAMFNGALQLGSAVGISAIGSIEANVNATHGGDDSYAGRAAAYWFLLGVVTAEFLAMLAFYRTSKEGTASVASDGEDQKMEKEAGGLDGEKAPASSDAMPVLVNSGAEEEDKAHSPA